MIRDDDLRLTLHEAIDVARALGVDAADRRRGAARAHRRLADRVRAGRACLRRHRLPRRGAGARPRPARRVPGRTRPGPALGRGPAIAVREQRVRARRPARARPALRGRAATRSPSLLARVPLVRAEAPGVFRFHPLLRDFLERRRDRADATACAWLLLEGARLQLAAGRRPRRSDALIRAGARDELLARAREHGFTAGRVRRGRGRRSRARCARRRAARSRRGAPRAARGARSRGRALPVRRPPVPRAAWRSAATKRSAWRSPIATRCCSRNGTRPRRASRWPRPSLRWSACWRRESPTSRWRCGCARRSPSPARCRATPRSRRPRCAAVLARVETTTGDAELRALAHHQASFVALAGGDVRRCRTLSSIAVELAVAQRPLRAGSARAEPALRGHDPGRGPLRRGLARARADGGLRRQGGRHVPGRRGGVRALRPARRQGRGGGSRRDRSAGRAAAPGGRDQHRRAAVRSRAARGVARRPRRGVPAAGGDRGRAADARSPLPALGRDRAVRRVLGPARRGRRSASARGRGGRRA